MTRRDIGIKCWEEFGDAHHWDKIPNPNYPTEPAIAPLSAYGVTKGEKWRDFAVKQLNYAHDELEHDGILRVRPTDGQHPDLCKPAYIHRDMQARQIYNYYLAYKILGDEKYYHWAVYCAEQMIRALPRGCKEVQGRKFWLFTAEDFDVITQPRSSIPAPTNYGIDANQNAEVGLAFGLLAADPKPFPGFQQLPSLLLTKQECQAIAMRETMASMLVQDDSTGVVPDPVADTMYGSYTSFSWVWVTMLDIFGPEYGEDFRYMKPQFASHIFSASNWLKKKMDIRTGRDIYYPYTATGKPVGPTEYTYRLPLYWFTSTGGITSFIEQIFEYMAGTLPDIPVDNTDAFVAAWAYYIAMGFPLSLLGVTG
jgi:hypothetical protein